MSDFSTRYMTVTLIPGATGWWSQAEIFEHHFQGYDAEQREVWRVAVPEMYRRGVTQALQFSREVYHVGPAERIVDRTRRPLTSPVPVGVSYPQEMQ